MKHTYSISGMSCKNCRAHVEEALKKVEGITNVEVSLEKALAVVEMDTHVPLGKLQEALKNEGGNYGIHIPGTEPEIKEKPKPSGKGTGIYYCPMHCEGDKTYDKPGDCPVCGMDLVEQPSVSEKDTIYLSDAS